MPWEMEANTTYNSVATVSSWLPIWSLIIAAVIIFGLLLFVIPIFDKRLKKLLGFLYSTVKNFAIGSASAGLITGIYFLLKWLSKPGTKTSMLPIMKWVSIVIGAYFILAVFGWLVKKIWKWSWKRMRNRR